MNILTVIPARGGSKGVPGKNSKLLNGKPLIQYTIESALKANLNNIVVNSDDDAILTIADKLGVTTYKRNPSLATDSAKSIDVILDMLTTDYTHIDIVILLQATYPFRPNGFIEKGLNKLIENNLDSLISVLPVPHAFNPHWVFKQNNNGILQIATGEKEIISRRQDLPDTFYRDGALYITTKEVLVKQKSFLGNKLGFIESDVNRYVNIDTLADWEQAELMAFNLNNPDGKV